MRYFVILIAFLWGSEAATAEWEDRTVFDGGQTGPTLRVISSTDTAFFAPIVDEFLTGHPNLKIEYLVAGSTDVYEEFKKAPQQYDLVVSSAMDLQLKLVNDGYALTVSNLNHPAWAHWRNSLYGFTLEPAAIVLNRAEFADLAIPRTRQEMIETLRENPDRFRGKIGTYDVRQSGLGYLFATQDARASETYWRLMEVMGSLNTRLYCCSGDMIEDVANGDLAISYNVLGSYANTREDLEEKIQVILPSDFPTRMMRTAFISKQTEHPEAAVDFLLHLTSSRWDDTSKSAFSLPSLVENTDDVQASTIALEPGLLVYLDRLKRQTFIREWENAVIQ